MTPCIRIVGSYNFFNRNTISFDCLTEILALIPNRFNGYINHPSKLDEIYEKYLIYQPMEESEIPKDIWDLATVHSDETKTIAFHRICMIWLHLRPKLPQVINTTLFLLTIPHSSAAEEKVFSMIGKSNTKFRSTLD